LKGTVVVKKTGIKAHHDRRIQRKNFNKKIKKRKKTKHEVSQWGLTKKARLRDRI